MRSAVRSELRPRAAHEAPGSNIGEGTFADSAKVKGFPKGTEGEDDLLVLGRRVHRG